MNSQVVSSISVASSSPASHGDAAQQTIRECVAASIQNYLDNIEGQEVSDVYNMVLAEVEEPLLKAILRYTRNNQTKTATMLGLNRGTLRKKLKQYDML